MEKMIKIFSDLVRIDDLINDLDEGIRGVYLIAIEETKTLIIGQSTNIIGRFKSHLYAMRLYGLSRQNVKATIIKEIDDRDKRFQYEKKYQEYYRKISQDPLLRFFTFNLSNIENKFGSDNNL